MEQPNEVGKALKKVLKCCEEFDQELYEQSARFNMYASFLKSAASEDQVSAAASSSAVPSEKMDFFDEQAVENVLKNFVVADFRQQALRKTIAAIGNSDSGENNPEEGGNIGDRLRNLIERKSDRGCSVNDLNDADFKRHIIYQEYKRKVRPNMGEEYDDEEMEMVDLEASDGEDDTGAGPSERPRKRRKRVPKKCLITQKDMKDPYYLEPCGHIFSKEGLLAAFKGSKKGCPQAGCANKHAGRKDMVQCEETRDREEEAKLRESFMGSMWTMSQRE